MINTRNLINESLSHFRYERKTKKGEKAEKNFQDELATRFFFKNNLSEIKLTS